MSRYCIIVLLVSLACNSFSQDKLVSPEYKTERQGKNDLDFNYSLKSSFLKDYKKYFEKSCGIYFHLVEFNVDSNGNVSNISLHSPASNMTKFLKEALIATSGNWKKSNTHQNKTIVLPVYFEFPSRCDIKVPDTTIFYAKKPEKGKGVWSHGLFIEKEEQEYIYLSPVTLVGIMFCPPIQLYLEENKKKQ